MTIARIVRHEPQANARELIEAPHDRSARRCGLDLLSDDHANVELLLERDVDVPAPSTRQDQPMRRRIDDGACGK
ncbi:MAG: hypothetical protein JWM12_3809 [Ilumatobacteraceae bacterium]|nr:hypothetical protein [Ilumatobacteraceae bacterium]